MMAGRMTRVFQKLRAAGPPHADQTDGALLSAFLHHRDEAAFEALVRRHGPMVLGVCRRVLAAVHDAEDAFQATFLVLARKAASIRQTETVGNWLYGVAYRTALHADRQRARRQAREKQVKDMPHPLVMPDAAEHELLPYLDQELNRLPDRYRVPVVLCDLEGRTRKEVARQLRLAEGTLSKRLTAARKMLARRLARHWKALSAGAVAAALSRQALAHPADALVGPTVSAASGAADTVSTSVIALTEEVLKAMLLTRLKSNCVMLFALGLFGLGGATLTQYVAVGQQAAVNQPTPGSQVVPATGAKAGAPLQQAEQQVDAALNKLKAAKGVEAEKKAFVELQQAVADLKAALHTKWGLPKAGKPGKEPEVPKITAAKLVEAFLDNQADADVRFANKHVEVTGTIARITRAPAGFEQQKGEPDYLLEMTPGDEVNADVPLQFLFAERDKHKLVGLKPKQTVTIRAYCRGFVPGVIVVKGVRQGHSLHFWQCQIVAGGK